MHSDQLSRVATNPCGALIFCLRKWWLTVLCHHEIVIQQSWVNGSPWKCHDWNINAFCPIVSSPNGNLDLGESSRHVKIVLVISCVGYRCMNLHCVLCLSCFWIWFVVPNNLDEFLSYLATPCSQRALEFGEVGGHSKGRIGVRGLDNTNRSHLGKSST